MEKNDKQEAAGRGSEKRPLKRHAGSAFPACVVFPSVSFESGYGWWNSAKQALRLKQMYSLWRK